jgi:hypothetical protein
MIYFKDDSGEIFAYDNDVDEKYIKDGLKKLTKEEVLAISTKNGEREKSLRIFELQRFLSQTDFKVMPDYDQPNEDIKKQRQEWRDEIRNLSK